jgi:methylglutamate dehydrogenase subunit D
MNSNSLTPRPAFSALPVAASTAGVVADERDGLGIANILVRQGQAAALRQRCHERWAIELPQGPQRAAAGGLSIAGTGPEAWLAIQEGGGNAFAASLKQTLAGLASVTDQSDGYAVLRLSGPQVRPTLAKLVPIDVHPRAFAIRDVAVTVAAHIGTLLWRLADGADGSAVFEVAVFRSMAGSFWHALNVSAAEFGLGSNHNAGPA